MKKSRGMLTVSQADLMNTIYEKFKSVYTRQDIVNVISALEESCKELMTEELSEKHPLVQVKIFPGLSVFGRLVIRGRKNVFGVMQDIPEHINVRAQIAKGYAKRLNEEIYGNG